MKFSLNWSNVINPERTELVFANRNKEFGGYVIRKTYVRTALLSLFICVAAILLLVVAPMVASFISSTKNALETKITESVTLAEPPPIDKSTPPPPPVEPPPPVQETIKFTPPKVVKDEEAEEPPPTQEQVKETTVSTVTQEGEKIIDLPPDPVVDPDEGKIFTVVEEMPSFPGGEEALMKYLGTQIKYPVMARENGISGRVYLSFYVDKDGKVKEVKVLRGIGGGCDEEALRVVRAMPDWKPGRQNGRNVAVYYNVPVSFNLK